MTLCPVQPRGATAVPTITNSVNTHRQSILEEVALPHNTKHTTKPVPSREVALKATRRRDIGTQQNTMPTIPYHALSQETRARRQPCRRSAGTNTTAQSMSSLSTLLRTHPSTRPSTHRPQVNAVSTLKVRHQVFLEVTLLDRRLTISYMRQMGTSETVRGALG